MEGQKVEELREVKKELGLLEKQIRNGEEEKKLVENERDQAREGENKHTEELKRLRKRNEGLAKESTSLKEEIKILRSEGEKSGEEASQSRREGKMLEEQRDEANREARKIDHELDRLEEITEGRMKSDEESQARDKQIFELQQLKAEKEEENRREQEKLVKEKELQAKESEVKYRQVSDLQLKTTDLNAELEAAKKHVLKLRRQVEQKDEAKMTREQNWDEYRQFWGLSAAPSTNIPPIAGPSPAPRNTPLVRLSSRVCMPVRPQTISLAQTLKIGVIKSANVLTRSKATGRLHATTENDPLYGIWRCRSTSIRARCAPTDHL